MYEVCDAKRCLSSSEQCLHICNSLSGGMMIVRCLPPCIKTMHNLALPSWKHLKSACQCEVDKEFLIFIVVCALCSLHLLGQFLAQNLLHLCPRGFLAP